MNGKIVENYCLLDVLGAGQYGKVYKALNFKSNQIFACKVVKIEKFKEVPKLEEFMTNELQALSKISNNYVVRFIELIKTANHYYFFYEYCNGGTLEDCIKRRARLDEQSALRYFKQLLIAFTSLIKENIMHRDLKPSNILFHNGQIKIGDFGFCKQLEDAKDLNKTMVGSPIYMAPEILLGYEYTIKSDIWSLGCVLYEMLFGACPYEEKTLVKLVNLIETSEIKFPSTVKLTKDTEKLILKLLSKNPESRISWEELFQSHLSEQERTEKRDAGLVISERRPGEAELRLFYKERSKVLFLYKLLEEAIVLSFNKNVPLTAYMVMKYLAFTAEFLKQNLVDNFNVAAFPGLRGRSEQWPVALKLPEFKNLCTAINKQIELVRKNYKAFKDEAKRFFYSDENTDWPRTGDLQREVETPAISLGFLRKYLLKYCEDIHNCYLKEFMDFSNPDKTWLAHIYKVLDCLVLDELFQNFFGQEERMLESQDYFQMLKKFEKSSLLKTVNHKFEYIRGKFFAG